MSKLLSASESLYLGDFPSTKRTSFSCSHYPAIVKVRQQLKIACYYSSFHNHHERTGISSRRKDHLCHAVPLPEVATGNDSEGSLSSSSTSERECKVGADRVNDRDLLMRFQRGFEVLNKVYEETRRSRWTVYGMNAWERMPPWIKLPTAIFLPWFLFVSLLYGPSASIDLLPLWIIGPLMVGLLVKMSMKMSTACRQWLADKNLKQTVFHVIEAIRTGQWFGVVGTIILEARLQIMEKAANWLFFIRSGGVLIVLKQHLHRKLTEWREAWIDKFQDWRLVYLRWERTLKNIV